MTVCDHAMSDTSMTILESTGTDEIVKRRIENYEVLLEQLSDLALFRTRPTRWAPLGFPLVSENQVGLRRYLASHHVYAPHHWNNLPSDPLEYPREHQLAARLVTLPCDQRYDLADMRKVAALVREFTP